MHRVPIDEAERGTQWPEAWPRRLQTPPYWLNSSQMGIYGKPAPQDFAADHEHWKQVIYDQFGYQLVQCEECHGHESCLWGVMLIKFLLFLTKA